MAAELLHAPASADRLDSAERWLRTCGTSERLLIVGPSLLSARRLAARAARLAPSSEGSSSRAVLGWHCTTLPRLIAELATDELAHRGRVPASRLALETAWAGVVHTLERSGRLGPLAEAAPLPGLPRALARTAAELRSFEVEPRTLEAPWSELLAGFEQALHAAGLADMPQLLHWALARIEKGAPHHPLVGRPTLLLDVPLSSPLEARLVAALLRAAPKALALVPSADGAARERLETALDSAVSPFARLSGPTSAVSTGALGRLHSGLFDGSSSLGLPAPGERSQDDSVQVLSAPGEARECVELVRRVLLEADRGVPFEEMAVLLRASEPYARHLEEAFRRADVPAYFSEGRRRPDPSGRALLALLSCAEEGLSARRFAEYLSLEVVPFPGADREVGSERDTGNSGSLGDPDGYELLPPALRALGHDGTDELPADDAPEARDEPSPPAGAGAPSEGASTGPSRHRHPRAWEALLIEARVHGGRERWRQRLQAHEEGLVRDLEALRAQTKSDPAHEGSSAPVRERLERNLAEVRELAAFALPLVDALAALPAQATWAQWREKLRPIIASAVRHPERLLTLLDELGALDVPHALELARLKAALTPFLLEYAAVPDERPEGRVFVGPIDAGRGRAFSVVFVPGLAERMFPQRVLEDPLLLDAARKRLAPQLETQRERAERERLSLALALGAARSKVVLSYPRLDVEQGRPRVPSFYGLEVLRAVEGRLPSFDELKRRADQASSARLGWPAPLEPAQAIDSTEHDLAVLARYERLPRGSHRGACRYLLEASPTLARALRQRWMRWLSPRWQSADGLVNPSPEALQGLAQHRLSARAYSPTALQHFAACPYRFFLQAILRLAPREALEPAEELDPLQKGQLVHQVQFELLAALAREGRLPTPGKALEHALERLEPVLVRLAEQFHTELAPTLEQVWLDALAGIRADLRGWLERMANQSSEWTPWRFELSFGLPLRHASDEASTADPVTLDSGLRLRGSIDLVERHRSGRLRATDYKTGKARASAKTVVGRGRTLQPVLYAQVLEKLVASAEVEGGRLFYCTQAGEYREVSIPLDARARIHMGTIVEAIQQSLETGFLPAAPDAGECDFCDYRSVCGPDEELRARRKRPEPLAALQRLRSLE